MFCTKCGAAVPAGAAFCTSCGQPIGATPPPVPVVPAPVAVAPQAVYAGPGAPPVYAAPGAQPVYVAPAPPYAGFWLRFVAYLIDGAIGGAVFGVLALILILAVGGMAVLQSASDQLSSGDTSALVPIFMAYGFFILVALFGGWLYYALMESSAKQGTLGKMAMGLTVTDMNGQRVSFGRASGRFFSKIITGLIPFGIGYIMAGFTEKKQALHDMIASCLVMKKV
jgi:uncharacterized RDD family membrane protein YckC